MRLFAAVVPPGEVLDEVVALTDTLPVGRAAAAGVNVRRVARPLLHVTLAFIGEADLPGVTEALGAAAAASAPVPLRLAGGGVFNRDWSAVLWIGVAGALDGPARAVRAELAARDLPWDDRPYRPHLTLARPGDRAGDLVADLAALEAYRSREWLADELCLFASTPGPHHEYRILHRWPLG